MVARPTNESFMNPPVILFDPSPRTALLIFAGDMRQRFERLGRVVGLEESNTGKLPKELVEATLPAAVAIIGQTDLDAARLARATRLKVIINVEGNFAQNVDYAECFRRGIQVLSIAPVFAQPVAEMALGMALDLARGITRGDRLMREGREQYGLAGSRDCFLLRGATMSFIGCGNLGRALLPLLAPFRPRLLIHDPWLPEGMVRELGGEPATLEAALSEPRVIFALAGVTVENKGLLSRARLETIRGDAIFLLLSRAGLIDFDALLDLVAAGRFRAGTDVFPEEPAPADSRARAIPGLLLSPHRAGSLPTTLAAIGEMVVDDLEWIQRGLPPQRLSPCGVAHSLRPPPGRASCSCSCAAATIARTSSCPSRVRSITKPGPISPSRSPCQVIRRRRFRSMRTGRSPRRCVTRWAGSTPPDRPHSSPSPAPTISRAAISRRRTASSSASRSRDHVIFARGFSPG